MIKRNELPSQKRLKELFSYDPDTGELRWIISKNSAASGKLVSRRAGNCGHIGVNVDGKPYLAHRVIWKLVTGDDPIDGVDHKDGQHTNNRWVNLREATHVQNMANRKKPVTNTSGVKGVHFHKATKKWSANVTSNNRKHHIGYFNDIRDAEAAVNAARDRLHGEFARAA